MQIPSWALDACLDDETFALAYEAVPAERRALLKTAIARHYFWTAPETSRSSSRDRDWTQGFASRERSAPAEVCLLLFDAACHAPARLLAALLPALNAGVGEVLAVHVRGTGDPEPPAGVLAAFELAGQEAVVELPPDRVGALLRELATQAGSCVLLALGGTSSLVPEYFADGALRRVWAESGRRDILALVDDGPDDPDLAALAFAHAGARILVAGTAGPLPEGPFESAPGGEGDGSFDVRACYAPASRVAEALSRHALAFGPRHEACWLHPDLGREFFLIRRVAWTTAENGATEEA